jgi:uncharacterized protein YkwD
VLRTRPLVAARRAVAALAACIAAALLPAQTASARADPREAMLARLAEVRQSHGLAALRHSPPLARAAGSHARALMRADGLDHALDVLAPGFRSGGEALARQWGWSLKPRRVVRMWMGSGFHRAMLLDPGFTHAGVGWWRGRFGGRLATIWVLRLGGR